MTNEIDITSEDFIPVVILAIYDEEIKRYGIVEASNRCVDRIREGWHAGALTEPQATALIMTVEDYENGKH